LGTHLQHTGQTGQHIFALDLSNKVDSCKDVPFGGFVHIAAHFRDQIPPQSPIFGVQIGVFNPNVRKIQTFIFSKLLHWLQQNFAKWLRPPSALSWVVQMCPKQIQHGGRLPSWKIEKSLYLCNVLADF